MVENGGTHMSMDSSTIDTATLLYWIFLWVLGWFATMGMAGPFAILDGPFGLFRWIRAWLIALSGNRAWAAKGVHCMICLSPYFGLLPAWIVSNELSLSWPISILVWLSFTGGICTFTWWVLGWVEPSYELNETQQNVAAISRAMQKLDADERG